jgi:hypothetical protein
VYNNQSNYVIGGAGGVSLEGEESGYYGELVKELVERQSESIEAKYSEQEIREAIETLREGTLSEAAYSALCAEIRAGAEVAMEKMKELRESTSKMAEEVYETSIGNRISVSGVTYHVKSQGNLVINVIVMGGLCVLLRKFWGDFMRSGYPRYFSKYFKQLPLVKRKRSS